MKSVNFYQNFPVELAPKPDSSIFWLDIMRLYINMRNGGKKVTFVDEQFIHKNICRLPDEETDLFCCLR